MKKSIFLFFAAILCATSAWAADLTANYYIYFEKPSDWSNVSFLIGHNTYSSGYNMTKISNTNLYYWKTESWGGYTQYAFIDAKDWGGEGNGDSSKPANRKQWANHSTNTFTTAIKKYHLFTTAGSKSSHASDRKIAINRTQTIKVQLKDGSNWVDATVVPADLTASTYAMTDNSTAVSAASASLAKESTTVSATVDAAYSAAVSLSCTNVLDGYLFDGWYDANGNKITSYTVSAAVTVYARFIQTAEETHPVTVSYKCGETELQASQTLSVGESTANTAEAPEFKDYTFSGWELGSGVQSVDATANPISITTKASGDYTLTAKYTYIEPVMKTIYCKMEYNWWTQANAAISAYISGTYGESTGVGSLMTLAPLESNVWKIDVDVARYQKIKFIRVNPEGTSDWGAHTGLVEIPTDDKNLYTITEENKNNDKWGTDCPGTWSVYEAPAAAPTRYITGSKELVGGEEGWKANEVEMTYDNALSIYSHTFSASALTTGTEYKLKVTDGTWDNHWGTINGTFEGVSNDGDGNVCFKLSTVGDVTVTFDGAKVTLSTTGAFYVPVVYDYYIVGSMNNWAQNNEDYGMSKVGETTTYAKELTLAAGTYEFKVKKNGEDSWYGFEAIAGDYAEISNKDGNIQLVLAVEKTFTVNFDSNTKKITFEDLTAVTYSDITIQAYSEGAAPQIWWWNGGSKCADADQTENPSSPGNKYTWETAPAMTAVTGEANWYEWTFTQVNDLTGISFKFKNATTSSSNFEGVKANTCYDVRDIANAKTTECGVTPSDCLECSGIYLKGTFNSWGTDHEFMKTADANVITTTVTITKEGNYNFKVYTTEWLGNDGGTMARGGTSVETGGWTMEKDKNEVTLAADMEGDYIFTYTINTKKLTITFPVVVPQSFPNQPTTLYFHPSSEWKKGNERYAAYIYNNGADNEWIDLKDADSDGIYELANPQKYAKVIICRMDKTKAENNWENKWDQIESGIEIPNTAGDLNTCLAFWTNCKANVPVSECTWVAPTPLTDANWSAFVTAYAGKTINAVIERSFKSGQYHTLCLPFDIPTNWLGEGTEAYQLTSIVANNTGDKLSLNATLWNTIVAGQPYIIVPVKGSEYEHVIINGVTVKNASAGTNVASGDGYEATLKAVTATDGTKTDGSTEYYVGANDGYLYNAQTNKLGLRAIIELTTTGGQPLSANVRARVVQSDDTTTGFENITTTDKAVKVIENGQLIIIRGNEKFNAQGQKL